MQDNTHASQQLLLHTLRKGLVLVANALLTLNAL